MKTIFKIMMLITLLAVVACNSNQTPDLPTPEETLGTVEFSFDVKSSDESDGGRKGSAGRIENVQPSQIIITIQTAAGAIVHDSIALALRDIGSAFVSDQIELPVGDYQITEYFVEDAINTTIYVAPKEGSNLAYLVDDPLPIDFTITDGVNSQESPEVVSPEGFTPLDFGYPSFRLNIVNTIDFLVAAHIINVQLSTYEITTADIQVTGDGVTAFDGSLQAVTNQVRVRDDYSNYTVTISKNGYLTYSDSFDRATLELYENTPLSVTLQADVENYNVDAQLNSTFEGTGTAAGSFLTGDTIRLYADPDDTWQLHENGLVMNADGATGVNDPEHTDGGLTAKVGLLVGSWDDGTTYFEVGVFEEITVPADASLTLWCFDSDNFNNSDHITVSVQKL